MISEFCIRRPVATLLMSFALVLGGLFAYKFLPVAALPSAEFPVVNVSASLPGASPETMATSVATPLIKQFSTIAGIDSISTTNSLGSTSIAIQFVLDRDIDAAAADVQAAIARTQRQLPPEMTSPPSYRKVNPADAPILLMSLVSDTVPLTDLDAFAENVISPSLSTLDGVAQVSIFGQQKYAVRIQIDPTALAARGISIDQLQTAIASANSNTPLGVLQNDQQQLTITANTQLTNAAGFSNLIIATKNGPSGAARRGDARHRFGANDDDGKLVRRHPGDHPGRATPARCQHCRGWSTASRRCCHPSRSRCRQRPASNCSTTARPRSAPLSMTCSSRCCSPSRWW